MYACVSLWSVPSFVVSAWRRNFLLGLVNLHTFEIEFLETTYGFFLLTLYVFFLKEKIFIN